MTMTGVCCIDIKLAQSQFIIANCRPGLDLLHKKKSSKKQYKHSEKLLHQNSDGFF